MVHVRTVAADVAFVWTVAVADEGGQVVKIGWLGSIEDIAVGVEEAMNTLSAQSAGYLDKCRAVRQVGEAAYAPVSVSDAAATLQQAVARPSVQQRLLGTVSPVPATTIDQHPAAAVATNTDMRTIELNKDQHTQLLEIHDETAEPRAQLLERMHKWAEAAQLWREAGNKVEAERCVRTVIMPHLLLIALNKPDAWPALAQEAVNELDKIGVSLGGGTGDALAALAEDPQDLESLGKKLARLSHWHGSKSPAMKAVLDILRFQLLQRRVILLVHDSNFVNLTVDLSQTLLQRTKSGMNALLQLLADLALLDSRQGALPDQLAFSKDLSLPPGHVVITPMIVKAVHVVSGTTKGDLVVVDAKTLRARLSEVFTAQLRGAVGDMNMLMTKLIQRMEYISLTLHKREDAHKDALERFYIQLAAFDLVQGLKSRTGDNSLQAPIGWFRTIFPAMTIGLNHVEVAQIRTSEGIQDAYLGHLATTGAFSEGHILRPLCLIGSCRGVIPVPTIKHLAQLHRGLTLIHAQRDQPNCFLQGIRSLVGYFFQVEDTNAIADDADPALRQTVMPLMNLILTKRHAVWDLVETKLTRIDRARFQTRLAILLLLVDFNFGSSEEQMHSTIVGALTSDKRHGGIVINGNALHEGDLAFHLEELRSAGEHVLVCLSRVDGATDNYEHHRDLAHLPRRVVVVCPDPSTRLVNIYGHTEPGTSFVVVEQFPFQQRRLVLDADRETPQVDEDRHDPARSNSPSLAV
ncbi:hypothetical protein GGF32_004234 [Allomyces javanicus]|nr:hypothetical protein GGF32_004234 [Allomyces javanicus]